MTITKGSESVVNPLQESALNKKGLCDYVVNVASGCLHGCTFCYVPSTPVIRANHTKLQDRGVNDPQMDWGNYLFVREEVSEKLECSLKRKRSWRETSSGKGVVMLCSGTDPYQNKQTAEVTRRAVQTLLSHGKRVRILTRSPLWLNDLDILMNPNVTVGMSLPHLDDNLSRQIEPQSPPPSERYKALMKGKEAGCRLFIAVAPTPPSLEIEDFRRFLGKVMLINPEVIFWEPINARGSNGKRMLAAGLDFAKSISDRDSWAKYFLKQWDAMQSAAMEMGCDPILHIWPDKDLTGYVDEKILKYWWYKPTPERWDGLSVVEPDIDKSIPRLKVREQLHI